MTTNEIVKINKNYFIITASTAAYTAVFVAFPYLNIPPLNFLIKKAIGWLIAQIADALELASFFIYIDFRASTQGKDYMAAAHLANNQPTEANLKDADAKFKLFAHLNS
jgi:hypothetical protein